jgi:hypothetical protein
VNRDIPGEIILKTSQFLFAFVMLAALTPCLAAGETQTFTGKVSDAMCGAKHMMSGDAAECTRACIKNGSKYALVVGDKVYTLEAKDKAALDQLSELADKSAKVQGTVTGDTIQVSSVSASK